MVVQPHQSPLASHRAVAASGAPTPAVLALRNRAPGARAAAAEGRGTAQTLAQRRSVAAALRVPVAVAEGHCAAQLRFAPAAERPGGGCPAPAVLPWQPRPGCLATAPAGAFELSGAAPRFGVRARRPRFSVIARRWQRPKATARPR
jgi:hypothetical protein